MSNFKPFDDNTMVGEHQIFDKTNKVCINTDTVALNKTFYFGKNIRGKPIYALMDYDSFKIARYSMIVSTCGTAALGITTILLCLKLCKQNNK